MTTFRDSSGNAVHVPCADDPEAWFPTAGPQGRKQSDQAARDHALHIAYLRSVCAACPVREPCLTDALRWDDEGFRAGLTEEERRGIRKRRHDGGRKAQVFNAALEQALAEEKAARAARRGAA